MERREARWQVPWPKDNPTARNSVTKIGV